PVSTRNAPASMPLARSPVTCSTVEMVRALGLAVIGLGTLVWLIPAAPMTGDGQHYIEFVRNNLQHGASSWHERRLLGPLIVLAALAAAAAAWQPRRPWVAAGVAAPALLVMVLLTVLVPGSGTDASAYVFKWVRDGLFSNGVSRVVFLVWASYGALWLLLPR